MTKTLTEQWRDGTLPDGEYYVKDWGGKIDWFVAQNKILWRDNNNPIYTSERIEVLAPVPDYSEYQALKDNCEFTHTVLKGAHQKITQLENKLEIATKALDYYTLEDAYVSCYGNPVNPNPMVARKALKEMEGVK